MDSPTSFVGSELAHDALASLAIVITALILRSAALRALERTKLDVSDQLRWRTTIRNATLALVSISVIVVWAQELRALAISIAAIAAAMVIASKELIMCLLGSTLRSGGGSFRVGDRIEVAGVRGDVLDAGPLTTTILEVGPGTSIHQRTGRRITVPNSVFLSNPVTNETTSHAYVLHVLRVPMKADSDWRAARVKLEQIAQLRCAAFVEDARRALALASPDGVRQSLIPTEPVVYVEVPEPGRIELLLRFPAPVRRRGRIAQQILRELLDDPPEPEPEPDEVEEAASSHA